MTNEQRQIHVLSLQALLQEIQYRIEEGLVPDDQQQPLLHTVTNVLQTYAQTNAPPLLHLNMQAIRGQEAAKRALEVAAAGGHTLLLIGPPGAGKRMLAHTLPSLMPTTALASPFRSPPAGLDQATFAQELLFAHGGVLLLEDFALLDFPQLAALRQAVETHTVTTIAESVCPAHFLLVATMKPCLCGFYGDPVKECLCSADEILHYQQRIEEARDACFDLCVEVPIIREEDITKMRPGEQSARIRQRVQEARAHQHQHYAAATHLWVNADVRSIEDAQLYCKLDAPAQRLLMAARQQLYFSPRDVVRTVRIARTCADLAVTRSETILANHLAEALWFRPRSGR